MSEPLTRVIFRKWNDGNIIALMPDYLGTHSPHNCESYMHTGQHGSADPRIVYELTKLATPKEYASLKRELEAKPFCYRFKVMQRIPRDAIDKRRAALKEQSR